MDVSINLQQQDGLCDAGPSEKDQMNQRMNQIVRYVVTSHMAPAP